MTILQMICNNLIPKKTTESNSKIPRERKKLINRLKMLKRQKHIEQKRYKQKDIEDRIIETETRLLDHRKQEMKFKEEKVIENMKNNPKALFSYIKKQNGRDTGIGPFKIGNEYIHNVKEIIKLLVKQYNSEFSRSNIPQVDKEIFNNTQEGDLIDIEVEEDDIREAIGKLKENSAPGPDGIPAILLKNTQNSIVLPLKILLRKSIDEGKIHEIHKLAYITPIHKGGSKLKPEQYRPVSLTSHIMKVFEKVIKRNIMTHLFQHNLINPEQHGFIPGRSTQTQLLDYYLNIFEALSEGIRVDTVFLDFAKAFDKVDHNVLLQKIAEHKIKGKIGLWIQEFLNNRKYKVVANGEMSEEQVVLSGVPQGTVLAAILFIIISDIDGKIRNSKVGSFADDTKISKKIKSEEDKAALQEDLEEVYKWAEENVMKFNENKFQQISHGNSQNIEIDSYKNPLGEEIKIGERVKDLGVINSNSLMFKEHIDSVVTSSKIMSGKLLRTFSMRREEPMMRMFNTYIKSKLEYGSLVWSPSNQTEINKIERIQRNFTSKIEGLESLNYHERLRKLKLYSLERRRERYMIISAWRHIEGLTENILGLETGDGRRGREMVTSGIPGTADGKRISEKDRTLIYNSTKRKMERLFNALPRNIRDIKGKTVETFKRHLDEWLKRVPDTPKIDGYGAMVAAESNSIVHQTRYIVK